MRLDNGSTGDEGIHLSQEKEDQPHDCTWVVVATTDKSVTVNVAVGNLYWDQDGDPYLLAFEGERELRMYPADAGAA